MEEGNAITMIDTISQQLKLCSEMVSCRNITKIKMKKCFWELLSWQFPTKAPSQDFLILGVPVFIDDTIADLYEVVYEGEDC